MPNNQTLAELYPGEIVKQWSADDTQFSILNAPHRYRNGPYNGYCVFPSKPVKEEGYHGIVTYVPVHGGITYANWLDDLRMEYGFDCSHAGDEDRPEFSSLDWMTHECELMAAGILLVAEYEDRYLATPLNEEKVDIVQEYLDEFEKRYERRLNVSDNFGVMINLMFGGI